MATEIAILQLKSEIDPDDLKDKSSETAQLLNECFTIISQQQGFQRLFWGLTVEQKDLLRLFIDWDAVEDHERFMDSDVYKPFTKKFGSILTGGAALYHCHFQPHPAQKAVSNASTNVTEIIHMYFPAGISGKEQQEIHDHITPFFKLVEQHGKGLHKGGTAGGWVDEEQAIPDSENEEKGKLYVGLIGWESVQAHMDFREKQLFKENIGLLRNAKGLKKIKAIHVPFTDFVAG